MIHFKTVRWKNFLSTGNNFTEIKLDKRPTTLIVGENGSGKSTLLDAICFALFGKPYRNINKPQLVNSINGKGCLVEIEFSIGGRHYKIVRGIKPNKFEIWINNTMIDQNSATRDYQKYLEEGILKLNYKSFTQIVILGSASFTPFMQLPTGARRDIIEDILDIRIFSSMNLVLKEKINELKNNLQVIENDISLAKNKAKLQEEYIKTLEDDREAKIKDIEEKIVSILNDVQVMKSSLAQLNDQKFTALDSIKDQNDIINSINVVMNDIKDFERNYSKIEKDISFYHDNDTCPKCKQGIEHEFKVDIIKEQQTDLEKIKSNIQDIQKEKEILEQRISAINKTLKEVDSLNEKINENKNDIITNERYLQRLELEKDDIQKKVGNIDTEKSKLVSLAKDTMQIIGKKVELNETSDYYEIASVLLKDTGIKTKIIKKYLPIINKLVNKYLTSMDFFVQFNLDENFKEVIKSRHRDEFSYDSFSEGEKQRIDLALLFTWRTIAKLKNSASTNLLILDEVFDSSLDNAATEYVLTLLNTLGEGTNIWVISHKGDQLFDKFHHVVKFVKKQNFSVIA